MLELLKSNAYSLIEATIKDNGEYAIESGLSDYDLFTSSINDCFDDFRCYINPDLDECIVMESKDDIIEEIKEIALGISNNIMYEEVEAIVENMYYDIENVIEILNTELGYDIEDETKLDKNHNNALYDYVQDKFIDFRDWGYKDEKI